MSRTPLVLLGLSVVAVLAAGTAAPVTPTVVAQEPGAEQAFTKDGPLAKMGALARLYEEQQAPQSGAAAQQAFVASSQLVRIHGDKVLIDAAGSDGPALRRDLEALGLVGGGQYARVVSGWLPIDAIDEAAALRSLRFARPAYAKARAGRATSQGDRALRAPIARAESGVRGRGITVGVLSDSYNCLGGAAADVASGDLPGAVQVLKEYSFCPGDSENSQGTDEGRAMMQLVYDVAPETRLAFYTAFEGAAGFAQGIGRLADAGADVIVDDIGTFDPFFQDGIVAQAVDRVAARGVAYLSSAGNDGRNSYESAFRPGPTVTVGGISYVAHDFDPGSGVDPYQRVTIAPESSGSFFLQWDSPFFSVSGAPGTQNDVDFYLLDGTGRTVLLDSAFNDLGNDPYESIGYQYSGTQPLQATLFIGKRAGVNPGRVKYLFDGDLEINEYTTNSGTVWGHPNAAGAIAVGASDYTQTPEFGVNPARLRSFSSAGGVPIVLNPDGSRKATAEVRRKPEVVGPDGTNTTFFPPQFFNPDFDFDSDNDGLPNFSGTSASAPHVAGVAALLLEADPALTPQQVRQTLTSSAADMATPGFDFDSGYGFVRTDAALQQVLPDTLVSGSVTPESVAGGDSLRYIIDVRNIGGRAAGPSTLSTSFSGDVEVIGATVGGQQCADAGIIGRVVRCDLGSPAASTAATATLTVRPLLVGTLVATAEATSDGRDAARSNNSTAITSTVTAPLDSSDLGVSIAAGVAMTPTVGATLSYTVQISSVPGPQEAQAVTVTLRQSPLAGLVAASGEGWSCAGGGDEITCSRGSAEASGVPPLTLTATAPGVRNLVVTAIVRAATFDPNAANNRASASVTVDGARDLALPLLRR